MVDVDELFVVMMIPSFRGDFEHSKITTPVPPTKGLYSYTPARLRYFMKQVLLAILEFM